MTSRNVWPKCLGVRLLVCKPLFQRALTSVIEWPCVSLALHITKCFAKYLGITCSRPTASVFISAFVCTFLTVSQCGSHSTYARVSAKVLTNASQWTRPSFLQSVLTFISARVLTQVIELSLIFYKAQYIVSCLGCLCHHVT